MRIRLPATSLALVLLFNAQPTRACRYEPQTPAQQLKGADLVFLGRADAARIQGARGEQRLSVLHVIKGIPGAAYTYVFDLPASNCVRQFGPGELSVVLVRQGKIRLPDGNLPIDGQLRHLAHYLTAGGRIRKTEAELEALDLALRTALPMYLHDRKEVAVIHAPYAGKQIVVGKSTLRLVRRAPAKTAVQVKRAAAIGELRLVSGFYGTEGYAFDVLLLSKNGKLEVLGHWGREH